MQFIVKKYNKIFQDPVQKKPKIHIDINVNLKDINSYFFGIVCLIQIFIVI